MTEPNTTSSLEGANDSPINDQVDLGVVSGTLDAVESTITSVPEPLPTLPKKGIPHLKLAIIVTISLVIVGAIVFAALQRTQRMSPAQDKAYNAQHIDLESLELGDSNSNKQSTLTVNGQLSIAGSLQVSPGSTPANPQSGQIYYDEVKKQLGYYNGTSFVYLQGGTGNVINNTNVVNNSNLTNVANISNISNVTNVTNINNFSTNVTNNYITPDDPAPPAILLQGETPGTVQTGNFAIDGTGVMGVAAITTADIGMADINTGTIGTVTIGTGTITTAAINAATINTASIAAATINIGTITTANITTANIDRGNINLVNTTEVTSSGATFTINKFAELPSGLPVSVGETSIGPTPINSGFNKVATKVTVGSSGGPLQSVSVYVKTAPIVGYADIFGCACYRPHNYPLIISIYADDGNFPSSPSALMWTTTVGAIDDATAIPNDSWLTVPTDNIPVQPGTSYWVSVRVPIDQYFLNYSSDFLIGSPIKQTTNGTCINGAQGSSNPYGACASYSNSLMNVTLNYVTDPSIGAAGAMFSLSPTGQASFRNTSDSVNAFKIQNAGSGSTIFNVDTYYSRIAIAKSSADYTLDVNGDLNLANNAPLRFGGRSAVSGNSTTTTVMGTTVALQGGTVAVQNTTGTTNYLAINTSTGATTVAGATTFSSTATVTGAATLSSTATLNGATAVNNTLTNKVTSTAAFTVQNASAANLLVADTTNKTITIGSASNNAALYINRTVAAPANKTAGLSTTGASTMSGLNGAQYATKVTIGSVGGTLQSLSANLTGGVATNQRQFAIYADDGGSPSKPGALLASSTSAAITVNGLNTATMSAITLNPYTTYWLAFNTNDSAVTRSYNTTASSNSTCSIAATYGTMTNPFGAGCTLSDNIFNIYATYTPNTVANASDSMFRVDNTGKVAFRNTTDSTNAFMIQNATDGQVLFNVDTLNNGVAVQATTFAVQNTAGNSYLSINTTTGVTSLAGATTATSTFTSKTNSVTAFRIQNASSANLFVADTTNKTITVVGADSTFAKLTLTDAHFQSTQTTAPTISTPTNCGVLPTATVTAGSTDTAGSFTITTGTGGTSSTCDATLTFHSAYGAAPKSVLIVGEASAAAAQRAIYVTSKSTTALNTSFANSAGGADSTAYVFSYWIIE